MRNSTAVPVGLAALLSCGTIHAEAKRPMTIVDMINVPSLGDPRLSPDGSQLLYTLSEADWEKNKRIAHIWRTDTDGSNVVRMTNGENGESSPRWAPDGSLFAFIAKSGEEDDAKSQIYLISNSGGEAKPLTDHETGVSNIQWSPDGAFIYFLSSNPKSEEEKERDKVKDDVFAFDENYQQRHLWKVEVFTGETARITEGDFSVTNYRLSRDGTMVAHHRGPNPLYDSASRNEVWVMNADGANAVQITDNNVSEAGAQLSPDNSTVLFVSFSNNDFEFYFNDNIFLSPAEGGKHKLLLEKMPHEVSRATWSKDGKSIYFTANTGVRTELFSVAVKGEKLSQLTKGDHSLRNFRYHHGLDRFIFGISKQSNAGDIHILENKRRAKPKKITAVYDYLSSDFHLPKQEAIQWKGADGITVEGLLYYPLDYKKGTAYPLCVQTHGGPAASDKFGFGSWSRYVEVLTSRGWMVFKPNYRGSTGYGDDYLRDMVGHYYRQSHLDVMTGVDHLIAKGLVDGDQMVKMGWSGGGHMTNKIITHTDRFKAASSGAGAVNWISMYGQSDVRIYRTPWFGGTPWQKDAPIDVYWDHSPLKDIWKVTTPTLVLVGENDVRVPMPQSVELYRALKSNGVPTHLYVAPREPHGWRELRHELFKVNVELDWFEKHALGQEYIWEEAPATEN